jgi:hypothetical protein
MLTVLYPKGGAMALLYLFVLAFTSPVLPTGRNHPPNQHLSTPTMKVNSSAMNTPRLKVQSS